MHLELAERFFVDRLRGLLAWVAGLVAYCLLIVAVFPSIRDSAGYEAAIEDYPDALMEFFGGADGVQLTTGPGFVNAQLYSLIVPLLLAIVAIGAGASLAADERSGLLDLILANPVRRRRVVLERAAAMTATQLVLAATVLVVVVGVGALVDLGVGIGPLVAASTATVLLVVFHGFVALAVAAATGSRSVAIGTATVIFAGGYLLNALAGIVEALDRFRVLSPYHHAIGTTPVVDGWAPANLAVLVALVVAALATAVAAFDRRDLG